MGDLTAIVVVALLFVGTPWVFLHYVTKWKQAPRITREDEDLLDELHMLARRLDDRLNTVERIIAADNPDWRLNAPAPTEPEALRYEINRRN